MKNIFYLHTIILALLIVFVSCEKEDAVNLPTIGSVTHEVGYGEVVFNWNFPSDLDVEYVRVDFISDGETKLYSFSRYSENALIPSLNAETYTFNIRTADKNGNLSDPVTVTATPLEPAYRISAQTLTMVPVIGGVAVSWENPTGKDVQINVDYIDSEGLRKTYSAITSEENPTRYVLGVKGEEQVFSYYTSNPSNFLQFSEIYTSTLKPYTEIKFEDRAEWVILDVSSQQNDTNQTPYSLFDDNTSTQWQTRWSGGIAPYPHWTTFDMLTPRVVTKFGFINNDHQNITSSAPKNLKVEGSLDGVEWEVYGEFDNYSNARTGEHQYSLDVTPTVRYIKLTFTEPRGSQPLGIVECYVYGAFL